MHARGHGKALILAALLTVALAYSAALYGGIRAFDWNIALTAVGLTAVTCGCLQKRVPCANPQDRTLLWATCLFPGYVAGQLVPLPLELLRIVSPTRAELAGAFRSLSSPLRVVAVTIATDATREYALKVGAYALMFLVVRQLSRAWAERPWALVRPLLAVGIAEAALGLLQYGGGAEQVSGTYLSKNHYAGLLEMILPFALAYGSVLLYEARKGAGALQQLAPALGASFLVSGLAMFAAVVLSLSKAGLISVIVSLAFAGMLAVQRRPGGRLRTASLAAVVLLAGAAFVVLPLDKAVMQFGSAVTGGTMGERWPIAKDTLSFIAAYPLVGAGMGTYYPGILRYQTSGLGFAWLNAHNDYLQLLAETGVVGFGMLATVVFLAFRRSVRVARTAVSHEVRMLGLACCAGLAAMLIHSLVDFNMYVPANAMVFAWIMGIAAGLPQAETRKERHPRASFNLRPIFLGGGSLCVLYGTAWIVFLTWFPADVHAEQMFCRVGICDSNLAGNALQAEYGGSVAAVPPEKLLPFLQRNPAAPYLWCDLGESLHAHGRTVDARYSFARALALGPNIPSMQLRAARFHFTLGESTVALQLMSRAIAGNPEFRPVAFGEYQDRKVAVDQVVDNGLPDQPAAAAYFATLIKGRDLAAVTRAWKALLPKTWVDDTMARDHVDTLIAAREYQSAARAWAEYAAPAGNGYLETTQVFNGDFEMGIRPSPLDWSLEQPAGVELSIDDTVAHAGRRSARVRFDGTTNVDLAQPAQSTYLPGGRYLLEAFIKTEGLTTDQGVSVRVRSGGLDVATQSLTGTSGWTRVYKEFDAPSEPGLAQVSVSRKPSLKFDNQIAGTAWVDGVRISRIAEGGQ